MLSLLTAVLFSLSASAASLPLHNSSLQPRADLPSTFSWSSSGPLVGPKNDGRNIAGIKDPSVVFVDGTYHVFASTAQSAGYSLVTFSFTDFDQAGNAEFFYLDGSGIGSGYRAAPQVFYFEPHGLWYLVYQNGNAAYSTNSDINNPAGWSAPTNFFSGMPDIIAQNIGDGYWVDMWVICDDTTCHLYSSDDGGRLYRASTSLENFPNGMDNTVIAMQDSKYNLFEASNVYKVADSDEYLLIVEAIGSGGRYFRSWTATDLGSDSWTPLAASESNPFAGAANVEFPGGQWTNSISHGGLIRDQVDQTLTVSACNMRYVYQGRDPNAGGDYNSLPWRLALLTQTNSPC